LDRKYTDRKDVLFMKRLLLLLALPLALAGCNRGHPISVKVSKDFQSTRGGESGAYVFEKIAVFPFTSALNQADDPDGLAPQTMQKFFVPALDQRADYKFISPNTVVYAVEREGWEERYNKFLQTYGMTDEPDVEFLSALAKTLQCDAFLVPVVDLWQKDEVDIQENSTPATYVGATITVVDGKQKPGAVLFRATDEDYSEGARSETGARTVVRSSSGIIRSDPGGKTFAAPPFEDVAPKVVQALVGSLPLR
jgi:hypothetical protein